MAAPIPTVEPLEIYAGDSIRFDKTLPDYSAATWTLSYRLLSMKGAGAVDFQGAANGSTFEITVTAATTAAWTPGDYTLIGFITSGSERIQVYKGKFSVLPDPATVDHLDGRTYLERILAILEEVIEKGVIREVIRYSYGGVTTEVVSMKDAMDARDRIKAAIVQEEAQASGKQRRILTRFRTPR